MPRAELPAYGTTTRISSRNLHQLADRRHTGPTSTRGTRRTPLMTADYLDRMSRVQEASSWQKVEKQAHTEMPMHQWPGCSDTWLADQRVPCTLRAQLQPTLRLRVLRSGCSSRISSILLGKRLVEAIHASAGAAGGPNSDGLGGKHNLQLGLPHMHRHTGAASLSPGTMAF